MHIVLVHVQVAAGAESAFEFATAENAAASRQEPGVARFDVLRQRDDPARYVLVEVYRSAEAAVAHKSTAHYARWRDAVGPLMAQPRVGIVFESLSPSDTDW